MPCSKNNLRMPLRGTCLNLNFKTPIYKTCGNKNPSYKDLDYYYSKQFKRVLNRQIVETYWTGFLLQGVSPNPNENLRAYYNNIVSYMKAMYLHLKIKYRISYSNLSDECSAVLVIKRCLKNIFAEEEITKLIMLLKLKNSCDCLGD